MKVLSQQAEEVRLHGCGGGDEPLGRAVDEVAVAVVDAWQGGFDEVQPLVHGVVDDRREAGVDQVEEPVQGALGARVNGSVRWEVPEPADREGALGGGVGTSTE